MGVDFVGVVNGFLIFIGVRIGLLNNEKFCCWGVVVGCCCFLNGLGVFCCFWGIGGGVRFLNFF